MGTTAFAAASAIYEITLSPWPGILALLELLGLITQGLYFIFKKSGVLCAGVFITVTAALFDGDLALFVGDLLVFFAIWYCFVRDLRKRRESGAGEKARIN